MAGPDCTSTEPQSLAARKLLKKVLQSIVQGFCVFFAVVDVLGCLKGTRTLTPCRAPRPTQEGLGFRVRGLGVWGSMKEFRASGFGLRVFSPTPRPESASYRKSLSHLGLPLRDLRGLL